MKMISTLIHGVLDYIVGIALLLAPNLLGFAEVGGAAVMVPRLVGLLILGQALMTAYELGVLKMLPVKAHLMNDYVVGLFLAVSPWIFGFSHRANNVWLPHVLVGLVILGTTAMTETKAPVRATR